MENQEHLKSVFIRYIRNECSPQEVKWLLNHFETGEDESKLRELITAALQEPVSDLGNHAEMQSVFNRVFSQVNVSIEKNEELNVFSLRRQYQRLAAVAAVILIVFSAALYLIPINREITTVSTNEVKHDIAPGGNKATLTLADGRTILLENAASGVLINQEHIAVTKTREGQLVYNVRSVERLTTDNSEPSYNTITTPHGGEYMVILPDGSKVWLNAASSIRFPTVFSGKHRKVELSGEAYFEVAKMVRNAGKGEKLPFIVTSGNQQVIVLGTHFNVTAYKDEALIKTTLLEGSVEVLTFQSRALLKGERVKLKPGEQARVGAGNTITVFDVNASEAIAWKNGYFQFSRDHIQDIMQKFSRWYNMDVVYEGNMPNDQFVGKIRRDVTLSRALQLLRFSQLNFRIEGRKIIVKR